MASFNKIVIVGYLGRDVETRYLPDGTAVSNFSVATTEKKKSNGETQDITTWFRVSTFGKLAEICAEWLSKGSQVYLEGRLSQQEYADRDGNKRASLEVKATEVQFLGSKGDSQQPQGKAVTADKGFKVGTDGRVQSPDDNSVPF